MNKRALAWLAAITAVIALISIFAFDRGLALAVHGSGLENAVLVVRAREFLDIFTGRGLIESYVGLSQLLLGALFVASGLLLIVARRGNRVGRGLMFAGLVQLATIEAAWLIKDWFGRLRPFQVIASDDWNHVWFAGGSSFPSGHNAFFWGLFLPLVFAFPKYRIPLLIIPLFIAFARIDENYHFLSDVLSAIALAALVTLIAAVLLERWVKPVAGHQQP
ncbi:MAG: phosphatase PAP2 family protein [Rudaea sp.]|nr:phosphatase PAP2 family protein [Rudaea sp.]